MHQTMNQFIIKLLDSDDYSNFLLAHALVKEWKSGLIIGNGKEGRKYYLHSTNGAKGIAGDVPNRDYKYWNFIYKYPISSEKPCNYFAHVPDIDFVNYKFT